MRPPLFCRLCRNEKINFLYQVNNCDIFQCSFCNFIQVAEKPSEKELAGIYSESYFTHSKYQDKKTLEKENIRRISLVKYFLPQIKMPRILDFGCSTGNFLSHASLTADVFGYDISSYAVAIAKNNCPETAVNIWAGKFEEKILPPHYFDAICLWDVIEHLWEPRQLLERLGELLKPGGYFFLSTPDIEATTAKYLGKRWAFMTPPEHLSFFGAKSLRYLFESLLNFKIIRSSSLGKWVNLGFLFYKIKRKMPALVPDILLRILKIKYLSGISVYVPSGDIQYLAVKKP